MPLSKIVASKPPLIGRPVCPKCSSLMWLARIMPDELGYDLRTFECPECGYQAQPNTAAKVVALANESRLICYFLSTRLDLRRRPHKDVATRPRCCTLHCVKLEQFVVRRVTHTRTPLRHSHLRLDGGALCEGYVDDGTAQKVHQAEWQAAIDTLIKHIRNGQVAAGFVAAIERCGAILAMHAPPDGSPNELPDRLYVI